MELNVFRDEQRQGDQQATMKVIMMESRKWQTQSGEPQARFHGDGGGVADLRGDRKWLKW